MIILISLFLIVSAYLIAFLLHKNVRKTYDKNELITILSNDGNLLRLYPKFKNDYDVVMAAIKQNGNSLVYAGKAILNNEEILKVAAARSNLALTLIPKDFLKKKDFILDIAGLNGKVLAVAKDFRSDEDVVFRAIRNNGLAIQYVNKKFTSDINFVLSALQNKNDKDVVFYTSREIQEKIKSIDPFLSDPLFAVQTITNTVNLQNNFRHTIKSKGIKI